jgi:PAS domain S-box-containing protein
MNLPRQGRRIVWLVRMLATIGLAMVVTTTGLVGWTLAQVRAERARATAEQGQLDQASRELRESAVRSRIEIQAALDETAVRAGRQPAVAELEKLVRTQLDSQPDPAVLPSLRQLHAGAMRLAESAGRANAWRAAYDVIWDDLRQQKTMGLVRDLIGRLRSAVETYEGRQRLDEAIIYRRWRKSGGEEAARLAGAILTNQARRQSRDSADFKNQLAEFARLVELLGGEEQFDNLADLKDNLLKPVLDRMSRSIATLTAERGDAEALSPQTLEDLKVALFGVGHVSDDGHQTVRVGRGGLFTLRRDALSLRRERERLKTELAALFHELETSNANFAQCIQARTTALTQQMEQGLASGWRRMLLCGGGGSVLFLWLAWAISRGINGQVGALEQARAEAETGRQTTQKLMVEQQAAAGELARENAERRQAEEALRKSEAQLQTIVENLAEGVAVSDLSGQLLHFNRAALSMHGFGSLEECLRHLSEFTTAFELSAMDGTVLPLDQWPLSRVLRGENLQSLEVRVQRPRSDWQRIFSYGGSLVHDESGRPLLAVVTISDITGRKLHEKKLAELNKQLVDASRQAGMAEVATGVLHNVGNVLNSVNVSATMVAEQIRKAPVAELSRVVALLREQGANLSAFFTSDPRGPKVPEFLAQLADKFARQRETQIEELASLQKNVEHIKDIVSWQQTLAKVGGVSEPVNLAELIEDSLRMNAGALSRHDIKVVKDIAPGLPPVQMDKHKALQILVNLVRNARHACEDSGRPDKRITVRAWREGDLVRIVVADNGVGIPAENLNRIFNHGFTTKKNGHGFGLHSGANAAQQMGGSLTAESDGPGQGAAFTLELPAEGAATAIAPTSDSGNDAWAGSQDPRTQVPPSTREG